MTTPGGDENLLIVAELRDDVTAGLGRIDVALNEVSASAKRAAVSADEAAASLDRAGAKGRNLDRLASSATGSSKAMRLARDAALGLTLTVAAVGVAGVVAASRFEASMTRIQTQAGAPASEVSRLREQVLSLAPAVGIGPDQLAQGLYHLESAGFRGAQAMSLLRSAAEGARIGNADLETVTQALVATTASQIKGVDGAADAMGQLNAIVGVGDMKMQGLASALATGILPSAASAGLSLRDVGAALATITDNATPPDEAATRLRMTFALLSAPSDRATAALKTIGITGTQLATDMRKPNGLLAAVLDLKSHLEDSGMTAVEQNQVIEHAFGGGRTSGAILTLLSESDRLQEKYRQLGATNGPAMLAAAWSATQRTVSQQFAELRAGADTALIRIGEFLLPMVNVGLRDLNGWLGRVAAGGPGLAASLERLAQPIEQDLAVGLRDVVTIGRELMPTLQAIGTILYVTVLVGLSAVDKVLGFLADHASTARVALILLAAAFTGLAAASAVEAVTTQLGAFSAALAGARGVAAKGIGASLGESFATLLTPVGLASAAIGGLAIAAVAYDQAQDRSVAKFKDQVTATSNLSLANRNVAESYQPVIDKLQTMTNLNGGAFQLKWSAEKADAVNAATSRLGLAYATLTTNTYQLSKGLGLSESNVESLATAAGVDLTSGLGDVQGKMATLIPILRQNGTVDLPMLSKAYDQFHNAAHDAATSVQGLTNYFAAMNGTLNRQSALDSFTDAIRRTKLATDAQSLSLASNSDHARGNRESLQQLIGQLQQVASQDVASHQPMKTLLGDYNANYNAILALAGGNATAKTQLRNLLTQMGLSPTSFAAFVRGASGPTGALNGIAGAANGAAQAAGVLLTNLQEVVTAGQAAANTPQVHAPAPVGGLGQSLLNGVNGKGGDTATPRAGRGLGAMAFHARMMARVGGSGVKITSGYRTVGLGSPDSDHATGRAYDLVGERAVSYRAAARAAGGFAEFHGDGPSRHLHVAAGDTPTPFRGGGGGGGGGGGVVLQAGAVHVTLIGSNLQPSDVRDAVRAGVAEATRDRAERGGG